MKETYDIFEARESPYIGKLKKQITIRINAEAIQYFKDIADETDMKYQQLTNLYLVDCAKNHLKRTFGPVDYYPRGTYDVITCGD